MHLRALPTLLAAAAVVLLPPPAVAPAVEVFRFLDDVVVAGEPGEDNDVSVTVAGRPIVVVDRGAERVLVANGCFATADPQVAVCDGAGTDELVALLGDGDDELLVDGAVPANVCGGAGDDVVVGGAGADVVGGGLGDDVLVGGAGSDRLFGERRELCRDPTDAPAGRNLLRGQGGPDGLFGGGGDDRLEGGEDGDGIAGLAGDDELRAGEGDDTLIGGDGRDTMRGEDGADVLSGSAGDDELRGDDGPDVLGRAVDAGLVAALAREGASPPADPPRLVLDTGDDELDGGTGDDRLVAGVGETYEGPAGVAPAPPGDEPNGGDELRGGAGADVVTYGGRRSGVRVELDDRADDGLPGEGDRVGSDVEQVVGGDGPDALVGGRQPATLDGAGGPDRLIGGPAAELLDGGAGDGAADDLAGGPGADVLRGRQGDDRLDGGPEADELLGDGGADELTGGDGADDAGGGAGLDVVRGGPGDDRLRGGGDQLVGADGADELRGDEGADDLHGGDGDDLIGGGAGPDRLAGGAGTDVADYGDARAPVLVTLDGAAGDGQAGEGDVVGPDVEGVRGGPADDTLLGGDGDEQLEGGPGADHVDGGPGADQLGGGAGRDLVRSRDARADRIACGEDEDLAIADPDDVGGEGCERLERAGRSRARRGREVLLTPAGAGAGLVLPGAERRVPLADVLAAPVGSELHAGAAIVTARFAVSGGTARARIAGGAVRIEQRRRRPARPALVLLGDAPASCPIGRSRTLAALDADLRGAFRVPALRGELRTRAATFRIDEGCRSTTVRVRRGRVTFVPAGRRRGLVVRAGQTRRVATDRRRQGG